MIALPTLANNGMAMGINNRDEIVGVSENNTVEPTCFPPQVLQSKPVMWRRGRIHELPTFPGDSVGQAIAINNWGIAVGWSGDCGAPTPLHALLWKDGKAVDLGNLGGVMFSQAVDINDRGQIVGTSDTADDFTNHAFLWKKGVMMDLGALPGDAASTADGINNWGQVVGGSTDDSGNTRAYIWQEGVMTDLNTLIPANSPLYLQEATGTINDWGQIAGIGIDSNGDMHAFLLTPTYCDDDREIMGRTKPNVSSPHGAQLSHFNARAGGIR
jgi:probable HAF family extracellular repeat protein